MDICGDLVQRMHSEECFVTVEIYRQPEMLCSTELVKSVDNEMMEYYVATNMLVKSTFDTER